MDKLISVVLPSYNGEEYLSEAIESIINQTYKNWELIIVDDCSTDNTNKIASEYASKDSRIRIIKNEINKKLPASLNVGFDNAKGEYYTWTSDDNVYYPEAFQKMADFLDRNLDFGMVYAICDVKGTFEGDCWGDIKANPANILEFPLPGACFMYRASIAKKVGKYDTNAFYMEDHDYWIRLMLEAPIGNIEEKLYMYRRHQNSLTVTSGDRASRLKILLGIKYCSIYKKRFPKYSEEIAKKWNLVAVIYNNDDIKYQEYKDRYNSKTLYSNLKKVYKVEQSKWILEKIAELNFLYFLKAMNLGLKFKSSIDLKDFLLKYFFQMFFSIKNTPSSKIFTFLGLKLAISRFKLQKVQPFKNNKPTLAFQLDNMDKGGLEEVVLELANAPEIKEKYNTVIITQFSNKGYLANIAKKNGISVYSFFDRQKNIEKLIKKLNIKIIHFHYNIQGAEIYKRLGVKSIYTIHNNYVWFNHEEIKNRKIWYHNIDKFIAVSSQVREFFSKKFEISPDNITTIPNGIKYVDTNNIEPIDKTKLGFKTDDFVVLCVASFRFYKYHYPQIKAVSNLAEKYPNIKLLLLGNIGEQEYYDDIIRYIKENNIENKVKIINYVPKDEVFRYLKMADCFINTSLTEGFSIAVLEAMLNNTPIILANIGGARDVIENKDIGIIVPHSAGNVLNLDFENTLELAQNHIYKLDNVEAIQNAIENMYLNKDEWKTKAKQASKKVKEKFNVKRVREEYLKVYGAIIKTDIEGVLNED